MDEITTPTEPRFTVGTIFLILAGPLSRNHNVPEEFRIVEDLGHEVEIVHVRTGWVAFIKPDVLRTTLDSQ